MITLRALIYRSLRLVQRTESGEYSSTTELENEVVMALQSLVSNWSVHHQLQPFTTIDVFNTHPNKASYTIGIQDQYAPQNPPDIESNIPEQIMDMFYSFDPAIDYPIRPISERDYFRINLKKLNYGIGPAYYYYKYNIPYGEIFFWPAPSKSFTVTVSSYKIPEWISIDNIDSPVPLPTPYIEALVYNLAVAISPEGNTQLPPDVFGRAQETLSNILYFTRKTASIAISDVGFSPYANTYRYASLR